MDLAYSRFDIKSVDRAQRVIEGIASTPTVDRGGDSMDPAGAQFTLPMPFLWQHGPPIGEVFEASVRPDGIHIKARISQVDASAPASLRERLEMAWAMISARPPLMRGLSIGWSNRKSVLIPGTKFRRVLEWIWGETSAVVVPMNTDATITAIKSFDQASAASGASSVPSIPGVSGSQRVTTMNVSEQLTAEKATLQTKSTRLEELMNEDVTNGGLDEAEVAERDALITDIKSLTSKVSHLQTLEAAMAAQSSSLVTPVVVTKAPKVTREIKTIELPKGTIFTRVAMAVAAGRGSRADTMEYAKQFTNTPEVLLFIKNGLHQKAEVGTSVVQSPGWGGELVNPGQISAEFIELLMPRTIIGRVTGFDEIPFNTLIIEQTGGSTFNWVGEAAPKPVGELAFAKTTLLSSKVAGIVVMSDELIRLSTPKAEDKARADMIKQCAKFIDQQFIRVGVAAGASNPASITNSEASPAATGTTAAALRHDLNIALATFDTSNEDESSDAPLVIVMPPALARGISLLTTSLGVAEFPGMNPQGGTLLGYQVIVSSAVDAGTIVIFKPSEIYLADDGRVTLDASREATLDMSGGSTPTFNLWQNNAVGLRAERWIRWQKKRTTGVVAIIDTAAYAPA